VNPALLLMLSALSASLAPPARYLALGDSYTIGEAVAAEARWPRQLVELLRAEGLAVAEPQIVARTGWTTDELSAALDALQRGEQVEQAPSEYAVAPAPPYQLVSLLIGVNNQYRGRPLDNFRDELNALIARAITYAGGDPARVLLLTIPDWGVTPFAREQGRDAGEIADQIDAHNAIVRAACSRTGVTCVDITAGTREAAHNPALLAADGLHPAALDYARWAQLALPAARSALALP
jgi:lysophospholipase L1-like esterase